MPSFIKLVITAALAVHAQAKTIQVMVGNNGLNFSPNNITADKGDMLEFQFYPLNHSVAMGDFDHACAPAATGGFFSGFVPVAAGQTGSTFTVMVNSTDPMVFYCTQNVRAHCQNGMFGVVNGAGMKNLQTYAAAANKTQSSSSPPSAFGGTIKPAASGTTGSPSSTGSPSASSSPAPTGAASGSLKAGLGSLAGAFVIAAFLA